MFAEEETLVGGVDDDRVCREPTCIQIVEYLANIVVNSSNAAGGSVSCTPGRPSARFFALFGIALISGVN